MPLDKLTVPTSRGDVVLPWPSVDALLDEFSQLDVSKELRAAFEAVVDESQKVKLTDELKGELIRLIDFWTTQLGRGYHDLQEGLWDLRCALIDDLHDAGKGP